jgi:hypothetical protein
MIRGSRTVRMLTPAHAVQFRQQFWVSKQIVDPNGIYSQLLGVPFVAHSAGTFRQDSTDVVVFTDKTFVTHEEMDSTLFL